MSEPATIAEPTTLPFADPEPGDFVHVLFWRPQKMQDGSDRGQWDCLDGRVISSGKRVVYEITSNTPVEWGNTNSEYTSDKSTIRFADPNDVFASAEEAIAASLTRKRPEAR